MKTRTASLPLTLPVQEDSQVGLPKKRIRGRAGMVLLAALILSACQRHEGADVRLEDPLVRLVTAQSVGPADRGFTGVVSARVQSENGFRVPGKVIERLVDTGVSVKAGQLLMRLDRTDLEHEITNREGAVEAAKAHAIQTAADLARYRKLLASGVASVQNYEHAKADDDSAKSLLEAAEAQAQVAKDEVQYSELCADADGVVMETLAEPGQVVAAGQTVLKLAHSGPREAAVDLPETIRPAIGSTAQAALYNGGSKLFPAHLRQLSDAANPLTRTFEARYVLDGDAAQAPLGATVTIYLANDEEKTGTQVPISALKDGGQGPGVWTWDDKTSSVTFRPVQIHQLGEENAVLSGGLSAGVRIVALGANQLHDGQKVRVAQAQEGSQ